MSSVAPFLNFFYGDDFTGTMSTAEIFTNYGIPTLVFTALPDPVELREKYPRVEAIGVAGTTRTEPTVSLPTLLRPVFRLMEQSRAATLLYKVCSTFDSAPQVGSIGRAIELALEQLPNQQAALLPAAPRFGRFVLFGNLFATAGGEKVYRLDRHPSMSAHPVTPMDESDILRHLARQTALPGELVDIRVLRRGVGATEDRIEAVRARDVRMLLFDSLDPQDLTTACRAAIAHSGDGIPPLFVGSHEVAYSIAEWYRDPSGQMRPEPPAPAAAPIFGAAQRLLVVSGSCAAITAGQIQWALNNGFAGIPASAERFLDAKASEKEELRVSAEGTRLLEEGRSVLIYTCGGQDGRPAPPPKAGPAAAIGRSAAPGSTDSSGAISAALGRITGELIARARVRRVAVLGGDTSGAVLRHLRVSALEVAVSIPGAPAPLCYVCSEDTGVDGLEIALKGGQVGAVDYLGDIQRAKLEGARGTGLAH